MEDVSLREVNFYKYCKTCVEVDKTETVDPCCRCLCIPAREGTDKPEYYKEKKKK